MAISAAAADLLFIDAHELKRYETRVYRCSHGLHEEYAIFWPYKFIREGISSKNETLYRQKEKIDNFGKKDLESN